MTMNGSATSPEQLMTIFAERAAGGDATGLIELYEPDGVFEPRRTVGAACKHDRRLAIAAHGAPSTGRVQVPGGARSGRSRSARNSSDSSFDLLTAPRPVKSSGVPVYVRFAGLHLIQHLLSKAST